MSFTFAPADKFNEGAGVFVSLTGGTNSGKTYSALRLARGIAGPSGKIAVLDTEGGRTLHLKEHFVFDVNVMDPPFRPARFSEAAANAESAGYGALVVDSFSMEWAGIGGVLDWQAQELQRMAGDDFRKQERMKMASWIRPKSEHKAMVYSFLQRRIPIIFSIRGEESIKPGNPGERPAKIFKPVCNSQFPYEVTVSFRLESERKGYVDLTDPKSWKMEGAHQNIFKHGDRISEEHGAMLAEWARGGVIAPAAEQQPPAPAADVQAPDANQQLIDDAKAAATNGTAEYLAFYKSITNDDRALLIDAGLHEQNKATAAMVDRKDGLL